MVKIMGIYFGRKSNSKKAKIENSDVYVCRDELDKKKAKVKKQVKFDLVPKYQHPSKEEICNEEPHKKNTNSLKKYTGEGADNANNNNNNNNGVIKVKILMKKEDATKLLLKCRGGVLEFMDVAQQLVQFPSTSVRVLSSPNQSPYASLKAIS